MTRMFGQCYSLISMNLSNFDTSEVNSMYEQNIYSMFIIDFLDLSNFYNSKVEL